MQRAFLRFAATELGRRVLRGELRLLDRLTDGPALDAMQADSLGRAYRDFQARENVNVAELLALAASPADRAMTKAEAMFEERCRVQHDLWHVVAGHKTDRFGELCLLAFRCGQLKAHAGIKLLTLAGTLGALRGQAGAAAAASVWEAYRMGSRAAWLYGVAWEELLPRPLHEVKAVLRIGEPAAYSRALARMGRPA